MKPDIEIAREATILPIGEIAARIGLSADLIEPYGHHMAKVPLDALLTSQGRRGKVIVITGTNPTPAGEGKTTTAIGLADALRLRQKSAMVCLREPSMGPVFGRKGTATGGGYSQVVPMERISLEFTGDFPAVTSAHNLLAAMVGNHLQQGNKLRIDPRRIVWPRAIDMNDRDLRRIIVGLGGASNGMPREDSFVIAPASEVMAILCLARSLADLKQRLGNILVAYGFSKDEVHARDLSAEEAMTILLRLALMPNLVQTLGGTPAFVHGGPFANNAHGCSSLVATEGAMSLVDYVVTEAGFGGDLGFEKFWNIKCRLAGIKPAAVVINTTIRALKMHGGVPLDQLPAENVDALLKGVANLFRHVENVRLCGAEPIVSVNRHESDTDAEMRALLGTCHRAHFTALEANPYTQGGAGCLELAHAVLEETSMERPFKFLYPDDMPLAGKVETVAREIYHAGGVVYHGRSGADLERLQNTGHAGKTVCMSKTPASFSDNPALLGAPEGFDLNVSRVRLSAGAGFVVVETGDILTMPGLPAEPAAVRMTIDDAGVISGLF